jgi:drug/metabolite transporter (DMT)-like permease
MRLFLLSALALCAFAANSVLNRFAVGMDQIDPVSFAFVRLVAGALMLALLVGARGLAGGVIWTGMQGRVAGVLGLTHYLFAFSLAYVALDAGAGALILFGAVQITMFAGALLSREFVPRQRWLGAGTAFAGLVVLLWPGMNAPLSLVHALLMASAGVGFGVYSLAGRQSGDPLAGTAANFVLAIPLGLGAGMFLGPMPESVTTFGVMLAVVSGALTSGLGYALWYVVVPKLGAGRAAVAQLSVPVLTAAAGAVVLGEAVDARFMAAAACVLGGVALASLPRQRSLTSR